jgi:phosphoribosyl-AMP cyclohydrolase
LKAHKIILAEVSPVLKKEFKTKNVLSWSFMNKEELILIIELIYKGEVRVEKEQVSKVLEIHTGFQST